MKNLPKWARIGIAGGITAVALNYFIGPSVNKTFKV